MERHALIEVAAVQGIPVKKKIADTRQPDVGLGTLRQRNLPGDHALEHRLIRHNIFVEIGRNLVILQRYADPQT
jgi:hypothetical protein